MIDTTANYREDGHLPAFEASGSSPPHAPAHARAGGPLSPEAKGSGVEPVRRITLTPNEAAAALGVGRTFLYEHVLPGLPVIRLGKKRLILVTDLVRWAERNAARLPLERTS